MAKRVNNKTKATAASGAVGMATAAGTWAALKYGVPMEFTVPAAGALFAWLGRWAAKLNPHE